jgi:hypothetical protein
MSPNQLKGAYVKDRIALAVLFFYEANGSGLFKKKSQKE